MATELQFRMKLTREQALRYYQGSARSVIVTATNGQRIQFPVEHIRPFIDQNGIQGYFAIQFDDSHKLIGLKRL